MDRYQESKCFFSRMREAIALRKVFRLYLREKQFAAAVPVKVNTGKCLCSETQESEKPGDQKKSYYCSKKSSYFKSFFIEESIQNFILKSILGFLGGILLTYTCFLFLVFSLNFTLKRATYICMGLGVILSLGLAFSVKIRCTVFLCIPQLFSKRGRQALLAYAFILALSGPAKNTLHNVEVMSESLACGQEQIKQAENELLKCVQRPNSVAKKSIEKLLIKLSNAVKYFKNFILQFYRSCFDILETIRHSQNWLYGISLYCNEKMGNPTERCQNLLIDSCEKCQSAMDLLYWRKMCQIHPFAVQFICASHQNLFCSRNDVPRSLPVEILHKKLDTFKRRTLNVLYVKVNIHQTFIQSNRSNTIHEEYQGMATEIRQKTDQFLQYFDFMSVIFGIFILVLFAKVIIYRHKFLTEDHYDNRFITPDFEDIDNTRAEFKMETILPLKPREKTKYIKVTSIRLISSEKIRLLSSFVFLIFATFKIVIHMLTDSSLYWILSSVRRDERFLYISSLKEEESGIVVKVKGSGMVAELFQNVSNAVQRQYLIPKLDPTPCLPDPVSPDWNRYYQILALVLICWLLALFEPYGLRLRHTVMVTYHPDRARERAIWLYNKIISHRNSYVKIARRKIRRKYKTAPDQSVLKFRLFCGNNCMKCLLCKVKITEGHKHIKCSTKNCVGIFCFDCYSSLKYCSICTSPAQYGDLSDLSEEKDSSDEEIYCQHPKKNINLGQQPNVRINYFGMISFQKLKFNKSLEEPKKMFEYNAIYKILKYLRDKILKWERCRHFLVIKVNNKDLDEINETKKEEHFYEKLTEEKKLTNEDFMQKKPDEKSRVGVFQKSSTLKEKDLIYEEENNQNDPSKDVKKHPKPDFLFKNLKSVVSTDKNIPLSFKNNIEIPKKIKPKSEGDEESHVIEKKAGVENEVSTTVEKNNNNKELEGNKSFFKLKSVDHIIKNNSNSQNTVLKITEGTIKGNNGKMPQNGVRNKQSVKKKNKNDSPESLITSHGLRLPQARVCTRPNGSSDSLNSSYRLCKKKETSSSDNQSCPQASQTSDLDAGSRSYRLKRSPGRINVSVQSKDTQIHSTDTSNDKFWSDKSTRNAKYCKKNLLDKRMAMKKDPDEELDEALKETENKKTSNKSGRLSWAPDLLSDLPLTRNNTSDTSSDKD